MKKLSKFEKGFATLENKELSNLQTVFGGGAKTNDRCTYQTHQGGNNYDTEVWVDGKHAYTLSSGLE